MNSSSTQPDTPVSATLADIHWMTGAWTGALGTQRVEEAWSEPSGGTMSTMVRLMSPTETLMIELLVIRETVDQAQHSLILHLRQFSPALEMRLSQEMPLKSVNADEVCFQGPEDSAITQLSYRRVGAQTMEVDVTTGGGPVLTAQLVRP